MVATTVLIYKQDTGVSKETDSPYSYKEIMAETEDTADATNTFTVTLADYGITTFKSIKAFRHSTNNTVVKVGTAPTTAVATGVLTVTLGAGISNEKYVFVIGGI